MSELLTLINLAICLAGLGLMLRLGGAGGVKAFILLATYIGNVQVLQLGLFSWIKDPVALGTVTFSTTFLATDILTEYFGPKTARAAVWLSFVGQLLLVGLIHVNLLIPGPADNALMKDHIQAIFAPAPALLAASLTAYVLSQLYDIWIFMTIKRLGGALWLRTLGSTMISGFVDTVIFSVLAWIVFNPTPLPWSVVWSSYILGTYVFRMGVSFLSFPLIYGARWCLPPQETSAQNA